MIVNILKILFVAPFMIININTNTLLSGFWLPLYLCLKKLIDIYYLVQFLHYL